MYEIKIYIWCIVYYNMRTWRTIKSLSSIQSHRVQCLKENIYGNDTFATRKESAQRKLVMGLPEKNRRKSSCEIAKAGGVVNSLEFSDLTRENLLEFFFLSFNNSKSFGFHPTLTVLWSNFSSVIIPYPNLLQFAFCQTEISQT